MTYNKILIAIITAFLLTNCTSNKIENKTEDYNYFDNSGRDDVLSGGVKMVTVSTKLGDFRVWTKRTGNNPTIKVLLLHGGPGANHIYLEAFDSYFPGAGIEYYYYDQLGSGYSDIPTDASLWNIGRFVEEVEQVRKALNLDKSNFFLYGQSWGGILALEYALKYQDNLKGLIISNMMASIPDYAKYAHNVLGPQMDAGVLAEIKELEANEDFTNPRYLGLIETNYYPEHVLRMPLNEWPEPVNRSFSILNNQIYVMMQGPSEFGVAGNASLKNWNRKSDLKKIKVPTLTIGGKYDTMDPEHMKWMATQVINGCYHYCPKGSHLSLYDDQETYFKGLVKFIHEVDKGEVKGSASSTI
jgi:proline iminopeptidase